jgi:hypothetical protein
MKKLLLLQISLLFSCFCFSQAFNAKLKMGSKEGIDILTAKVDIPPDANGPQTYTASNGIKYILDIQNGKVSDHKVLNADGKEIFFSKETAKTKTNGKNCQSCIIAKWPSGKVSELCNMVSCDDMKMLSKNIKSNQ